MTFTPPDNLARENAYLRLRNGQLQGDVTALTAEVERLRQMVERLHGRTLLKPPNPRGGGQWSCAQPPAPQFDAIEGRGRSMHNIDMPAGATIRLTATAGADAGVHRWAVEVHGADPATEIPARLAYGSQIGGQDREQRIDIPVQNVDCRLEVRVQHVEGGGEWRDDKLTVLDDTPSRLDLAFFDPAQRFAHLNGLLLSFAFGRPSPQT